MYPQINRTSHDCLLIILNLNSVGTHSDDTDLLVNVLGGLALFGQELSGLGLRGHQLFFGGLQLAHGGQSTAGVVPWKIMIKSLMLYPQNSVKK